MRKLVVSLPTPCCDHRQRQSPALAKQVSIGAGIVVAHLFWCVGEIELDGAPATRLQVDEQQPAPLRPEQIPRMRLAVQELVGGASPVDCTAQLSQSAAKKLTVCIPEIRGVGGDINQPLRLGDPVFEVGRAKLDLAHARVQPPERPRIFLRHDLARRSRLIVGPKRDDEAVLHVRCWLYARIQGSRGALALSEPPSDLDFERGTRPVGCGRDTHEDVTREQAHGQPVGVVQEDRFIGPQPKS
ncbi:MAG TPA: hypothetical protein VFY90_06905 [Tepidiformaceae bacterium]|nr:hypothetical protein [Tepidiformaceae bacterium]